MEDFRLIIGEATDAGQVREQNEDAVYHDAVSDASNDELTLIALADGMGGYQRGEVASEMAIDALRQRFAAADTDDLVLMLKQAFRHANERIFENGSADGEHNMMGTTLVAGVIRGTNLALGNVGDSRAYLVRAIALNQITTDHSLVAEQVAMGAMTQEEARGSQHRNIITRALGHRQKVDVDIFELTLLPGDRLLLSSDGLHDHIGDDEVVELMTTLPPAEAAKRMVTRAIEEGSTDNVSALCLWAAPVSVLEAQDAVTPEASSRVAAMVAVLVIIGLAIVIAIVGYILIAT
ncbi:MAG TPA: Stp1/IreP family PP2C-type Ser/Thr phosphatase [Thermomicrobiales bacterium]|nr:Stp1/IreP family PP2C-type Ser/Thr phosphatase [Thermomicrobiales bacterium]